MASFESKFKREISCTVDDEQSVTVAGKPMILSPANSHDSIAATSDNSSGMTLKLPPFVVCMETSYLDIEKKMEELIISKYSAAEKPMILSPTNSHASIAATSDSTSIVATSNDTSIAATSDGTFVAATSDNSSGMTLKLPPFVACMEIFDLDIQKKMEELTIAKHLQAIADSQQQLEKIAEKVRLLGPCPINNCSQHSQSTEIDHNSSEDLIFPNKRLSVKSESIISLDRPESPIETSNSFQELEKVEENIEIIPELSTPKFHPILVWSANLGIQFLKEINGAFNNDLEISLSGDYFKIFPTDPDHHKKICQYLSNSKINFFINTPKHLRVVIKGLHVNTSNSEIEEELTNLGFEIKSTNIIAIFISIKVNQVLYHEREKIVAQPTLTFLVSHSHVRNVTCVIVIVYVTFLMCQKLHIPCVPLQSPSALSFVFPFKRLDVRVEVLPRRFQSKLCFDHPYCYSL
ncbi:hypothetical protein CEXT_574801 [Caerostris extrusa]|uniref:Pre-C2HC domain-containing protein n=1 Tax=Caerostris extrusa TaxID=172846 RepID=A0AAV4Y7X1_CAEEX|nr:hypothetical protein CEXT_574801 [Caerostris extrusa]